MLPLLRRSEQVRHLVRVKGAFYGWVQSRGIISLATKEKMSSSTTTVAAQKLTREDWRKKKELEEARKAGTAPAEVDEEGR